MIGAIRYIDWNTGIEICSEGVTFTDLIKGVVDRLTMCNPLASEQKTPSNFCDQQIKRD